MEPVRNGSTRPGTLLVARCTLAAAAGVLLAEACARIWLGAWADPECFRRFATLDQVRARGEPQLFERHAYLGYAPAPGYRRGPNAHDSRGFRGAEVAQPKPAGEYRIACLGGSTTYTSSVEDWRAAWPARLEQELHALGRGEVRVVNAGCHNWTSYEHLINWELRVGELDPDLLIVMEGFNDLKARYVWPPEAYRGDNSGYRRFTTNLTTTPLREHSALWRIVAVSAGWMQPQVELQRALDNHAGSSVWGAVRARLFEGSDPGGLPGSVEPAEILRRNPPRWFERNLEDLAALARRRGAQVLFLSSPSCVERISRSAAGSRAFDAAMDEMNRSVRAVAGRSDARFFDLAAELPADPALYVDEVHHTAEGAHEIARILARRIAAGDR